jgi:hypothetical protein
MSLDAPRRAAVVALRVDHLRFLDDEAARMHVPRSRLLEGLLDFVFDLRRDGLLVTDSDRRRDERSSPSPSDLPVVVDVRE